MARSKQTEMVFRTWGGARRGAGRKPAGERALVSHGVRPALSGREPVLVTLKVRRDVWNLRARTVLERVLSALAATSGRLRVVHYSVQRDHVHLIAEAASARALSRGVAGLCVRIARRLNALMKRKGKVFADRFHERVLGTPRQVRNALRYVLLNARKHGVAPSAPRWIDPCSSARVFDGWRVEVAGPRDRHPVVEPRTWLLSVGWKRGRWRLDPAERPGPLPA